MRRSHRVSRRGRSRRASRGMTVKSVMASVRKFNPFALLSKTVKGVKGIMKKGSKMTKKYVGATRKFLKKADSALARV
jgi:hypothetical protein